MAIIQHFPSVLSVAQFEFDVTYSSTKRGPPLKISQRLKQLDQMVVRDYHHIWDCCCDHGLLGLLLLERLPTSFIHFVDINPQLIVNLQSKLERHYSTNRFVDQWKTHCLNAAHLPLVSTKSTMDTDVHLIIIAGVGGDSLIKLVEAILSANATIKLEFLLCPVHHNYKVRTALIKLGLGLISENLLCENGRFYELIHVSNNSKEALSTVGTIMWNFNREQDRRYLEETIAHYQRMSNNSDVDANQMICDYQALQNSYSS